MNRLTPIASQILRVTYNSKTLDITLDSGATVSYLRLSDARILLLEILPNDQLALLADEKTRMASLGEVDFLVSLGKLQLRVRGLIMKNLQAPCFGGTTFHVDNDITARPRTGEIKIHNSFVVQQFNPITNFPIFPPPSLSIQHEYLAPPNPPHLSSLDLPQEQPPQSSPDLNSNYKAISLPFSSVTLPDEYLPIPLPSQLTHIHYMSILPSFPSIPDKVTDGLHWVPQVCEVINVSEYIEGSNHCPQVRPFQNPTCPRLFPHRDLHPS